MPENIDDTKKGNPGGTDPTKTGTDTQTLDLSKISDDEFGKVFDDKRLWTHPRFKELAQAKKERDELTTKAKEAEEAKLKEQEKWQELANKKGEEAKAAQEQLKAERINNKLLAEAQKAGVKYPEASLKLVDRGLITIGEDGAITGAAEAVKKLVEGMPELVGKQGNVKLGSDTNPIDEKTQLKRFKLSQVQNSAFYRANEKDIRASMAAGLVEDDVTQAPPA